MDEYTVVAVSSLNRIEGKLTSTYPIKNFLVPPKIKFSKTILSVIDSYDKKAITFEGLKSHVNQLTNTYSEENERKSLRDLLNFIKAELHSLKISS
jgi:hypothetical protein